MKTIERVGKSKKELISDFMKEYRIKTEADVKLEIIDNGSAGILGLFGRKPARINFFVDEARDVIRLFIDNFLRHINITCESIDIKEKSDVIIVELKGTQDPGFLIGKEGRFLNSLQHLLSRVLLRSGASEQKILVDVDNYRAKHEEAVMQRIRSIAEKVKTKGKKFTLEPMSSRDRRLVHQHVEKDNELRTLTIGRGEQKRVIIIPAGDVDNFKRRDNNKRPPQNKNYRRRPHDRQNQDEKPNEDK